MTVDVKLNLPDDVMANLQREAQERKVSLDEVVSEVLRGYFEEPTEEEILSGLKHSLEQVITGNYRPALEFLDEIDNEAGDDADNR